MTLNYKCPACGGSMSFDAGKGMLKCDYCDHTVAVDSNTSNEVETTEEAFQEKEAEYADYHGYKCPSCGAEIVTDDNTAATFCSFCGNPTMIEDRMTGVQKPSRVIPFTIQKNGAMDIFKQWTNKGLLTPKEFKGKSVDKLTGMYIPFWLYDYDADVAMTARAEKRHTVTRGNDEIEITEHYLVNRRIFVSYDKVPSDASEKMDDDLMDTVEPYDYSKLVDFNNGYLSGFFAEKYDYTDKDLQPRVEEKVKKYGKEACRNTIRGYDSVDPVQTNCKLTHKNSEYVMMPVWLFNYKWKNENKTVAINGETGKVAGTLPTNPALAVMWWAILFIASAGLTYLFAKDAATAAIVGLIVSIVGIIIIASGQRASKVSGAVYNKNNSVDILQQDDIYIRTTERVVRHIEENKS